MSLFSSILFVAWAKIMSGMATSKMNPTNTDALPKAQKYSQNIDLYILGATSLPDGKQDAIPNKPTNVIQGQEAKGITV